MGSMYFNEHEEAKSVPINPLTVVMMLIGKAAHPLAW
tara:strand:+ start:6610 stop:6720 length:111 start_codon:yes stop_codon:yes gene_type:complete